MKIILFSGFRKRWLTAVATASFISAGATFASAAPRVRSTTSPAAILAAAGKADISPDLSKESIWLAGYGPKGRHAQKVADPLYARAVVLSDGKKTVALVAVDSIGIFRQDVLSLRGALGWTDPGHYLFVAATHDHSAPDSIGLWGPIPGISGVNKEYHRRWKDAVVSLVRSLASQLEPAEIKVGRTDVDPARLCRDSRDPVVIDPEMDVIQIRSRLKHKPIGTVVRWSCHAEALGSGNMFVTADFPGVLCGQVEKTQGGTCAFFNGIIGGLMTPDVDERSKGIDHQYAESRRMGADLARIVDKTLVRAEIIPSGGIQFKSVIVKVPVENSRYLLFLRSLMFGHQLLDKDGRSLSSFDTWWLPIRHLLLFPLPDRLRPWVETELSLVEIGPLKILGIPGELFPELAIGGYDGRYRFNHDLIQPGNPNPPDLSRAPKGPYLRDKVGAKYGLLIGLANDELGYIIPNYDFKVTPDRSMAPRPAGHHYEETNSIGPSVTKIVLDGFDSLLKGEGR